MIRTVVALAFVMLPAMAALAQEQTLTIDYSKWQGVPLVKTKFGVYQTPFFFKVHPPRSYDMGPLLREAGVRDLRYETGWGKPDTFAFDQVAGTAAHPVIEFAPLDPFLTQLKLAHIEPLLALTYNPVPLQTQTTWQRWKDVPSNLEGWNRVVADTAKHVRTIGLDNVQYEIWNEPDLPGDGGKVFFNGGPAEYGVLFNGSASAIKAAVPDADVGGPAMAYDARYARAMDLSKAQFISVHAYNNFPVQIGSIARSVVRESPSTPIYLTEYASDTQFGSRSPISRHEGAARFFRDVAGLLNYTDTPKVYWAQWIDNDLGMITEDLHKKALFNALKIYQTDLPVDRNAIELPANSADSILASSDSDNACAVLWNNTSDDVQKHVALRKMPFNHGFLDLYRIDATHGSYVDDNSHENLSVVARTMISSNGCDWSGTVPAGGVVFLHAHTQSGHVTFPRSDIGEVANIRYWFANRVGTDYADFDPVTSIARLGTGANATGTAEISAVIDAPTKRWRVRIDRQGLFTAGSPGAALGLVIDYVGVDGNVAQRISYQLPGTAAIQKLDNPENQGKVHQLLTHPEVAFVHGGSFIIDIKRDAPAGWSGRVVITALLRNAPPQCAVRMAVTTNLKTR